MLFKDKEKHNSTINIPVGFITLVFVALKLSGVINWPWLWVFSPMWIAFAIIAAVLLVMVAVGIIAVAIETFRSL